MLEQMERLANGSISMNDGDQIENEDGEDENATVGSKRKRVAKAPVVSRSTRGNLDSKKESAIVAELVAVSRPFPFLRLCAFLQLMRNRPSPRSNSFKLKQTTPGKNCAT